MSADNWAVCPRCADADPFLGTAMKDHTFREDYEIGVNRDGTFVVVYSGRCTQCKFKHEFRHNGQVER